MRAMMRINTPIAAPATTGAGTEDLPTGVSELGWGRSVALLVGGVLDTWLTTTGLLEVEVMVRVDDSEVEEESGGVEGGSGEVEDETDGM